MIIYTNARYKPKKKRKPKGTIAQKLRTSSLLVEKRQSSLSPRFKDDVTRNIQSLRVDAVGSTLKKESIMYTGTLIKGIATMHKSNCVPVIDEEQMRDISRMRRG